MAVASLWKLLGLIALVLMPFGMASVSAAPAHHSASMSGMSHCGGGGAPDAPRSGPGDCAMTCSIVAAPEIALCEPLDMPRAAPETVLARVFSGIHPETATPPPKHA